MSWVAYGAELLLAEPKGKQAPAPAPIPPPESGGGEEGKGGFINNDDDAIYVVYAEIALFLLVAFLNMQLLSIFRVSPSRDQGQPVSLTGGKTRNFFVSLLFLANFFRAFSLGLQLVLMSSISQASLMTWFTYLFRSLPSLIFLSTYSVLIYFWAQVYQAATLVSTPLLRPTFIFVNIAVYCIYAVITVLTLLLHAYEEYRTYSIFLIGVIYLAVSVGFFVYGMKVSGQLSDRSRQLHRKNFIIRRVMALSVACPIIFSLRGFYCLAFSFGFISKYYPQGISRFIWDAIIYMTSEWVPSLLMLFFFWPRRSHQLPPRVENSDVSAPLVRSNYPQAGARASQPLPAPSAARTVRQPRATYDGRMGDYQPLPQQQAYGGGVGRHGDMAGGAPHIDVWDRAKDGGTHVVPAEAALRPAADDGETPKPKGHR